MSMFVLVRKITSNVSSPLQCACIQQNFVNNVNFCSVEFKNDFMIDRLLVKT